MGIIIDLKTKEVIDSLKLKKEKLIRRANNNMILRNSNSIDEVVAAIMDAKTEEDAVKSFDFTLSRIHAEYGRSGFEG